MYKNVASQTVYFYAWDTGNNVPKTGDSANITAYVSLDGATEVALGSAGGVTELDATNAPGVYYGTDGPTQAETNGDALLFSAKSGTANIYITPVLVYTKPGTSAGITSVLGDVAHGGSSAVLTLERVVVASTTAGEPAIKATGNTSGAGLQVTGGASGPGINAAGGASGGDGFQIYAGAGGKGMEVLAGAGGGYGIEVKGTGGDAGMFIYGNDNNSPGLYLSGVGTGADLLFDGAGIDTSAGTITATHMGTDNKVKLSTDSQAGVTIPTVTDITNAVTPDNAADTTAILADTNELQTDDIPGTLATILADTGELQTDWADGGRLDLILDTAAAGSAPTAAAVADAVWGEVLSDHYESAGTMTKAATFLKNILAFAGYWKKHTDESDLTVVTYDTDGSSTVRTQTRSTVGDRNTYTGS